MIQKSRREWANLGKPRNRDNHFFGRYKEAKREFRKELRRKAREQEVNEFDAFQRTFEVDRSEFYKRISNARSPKCKPGNALKVDGKQVTIKEKVLKIWREHYQGLYSPLEHEQFDDSFWKYEIESHEVNDDPLDLPLLQEKLQVYVNICLMAKLVILTRYSMSI